MSDILSTISGPDSIKSLNLSELERLALEIRNRIIEVMAENGGHLASSMGAVELSIALHHVFDSPTDRMIWDVGHQTYPHKLLTGRNSRFDTVRKTRGLCGFTHPDESAHDHFHAGHAGTALSLAMGVAKNRDLTGRDEYIIPVIGDATLTCGLTLEALNNMSRDLKKFIVILNDNKMSISNNVGAITRILSRMLSNPTVHRLYQDIDNLVSKIPSYGPTLANQGRKITESLKNLVSPAAFFEQYGLSYIGPVDGHNIDTLIRTLEGVKDSSWPVVIHVITNKGQGLDIAVQNPITWHGVKPFDVNTCKFLPATTQKSTYPKVFGKHVLKMAETDPSIVVVTPAMSAGSCLDAMMAKFPQRCIDVGIAEGHCVTYSGGIAFGRKMKVIASVYSTFLQRALDNVFLDVCLQELPVVLAIDRAGIAGGDGATHNGIYDISFLNAMPNMVICQPRDGHLLKELLESAHSWERPVAIRYPNSTTEEPELPLQARELGKGELLAEGRGILLIGLGHMCETAMAVRQQLAADGISASVLDPIFVKPLDSELLCRLLETHDKIVTIEEHSVVSGMGAIVNNFLMTYGYTNLQVLNCGIPETFVQHGNLKDLLDDLSLSSEKIVQRIYRHFSLPESMEERKPQSLEQLLHNTMARK